MVEVDLLTGDHNIIRSDVVMDVGSSINPAIDIGQIEGAFVQGVGWSTTEELIWGDEEHEWVKPRGRLFTQGPGFYKPPAFNDMPAEFNVTLMDGVANKVSGSELRCDELSRRVWTDQPVAWVFNGKVSASSSDVYF